MTSAPSPGEFAETLAREYAKESEFNPFYDHVTTAKQRLCILATTQVYGSDSPLGQFLTAYEKADRLSFPVGWSDDKSSDLFDAISDMRSAWEIIEQDFTYTAEEMQK